MARGTKHPGCWACHRFMPPAEGFLDWDSLAVTGADGTWPGRPGGGLVGDGPAVTVLKVYYHSNTSHLAALCGFRSDVIFRDFSLLAVSANGTALGRGHKSAGWWGGVGFRSGSAVALEMSSLSISGFIYGVRTRYMVMGAFSMLEISDCACGIDLARSADAFGDPQPAPSVVCFSSVSTVGLRRFRRRDEQLGLERLGRRQGGRLVQQRRELPQRPRPGRRDRHPRHRYVRYVYLVLL